VSTLLSDPPSAAPAREPLEAAPGEEMLCLLGGPYVRRAGRHTSVPKGSQRLLAFVALRGGRVDRRLAAGTLWPDGSDTRAAGNLRSAVWRLKTANIDILDADKYTLSLRPGTITDVHVLCEWSARLVEGRPLAADLRVLTWDAEAADILPGWYDEWVICERERIRQRMLHGLEAVCRELIARGRPGDAVEAAMNAVRFEPLRESAQRMLIEAHLAEHNHSEARRAFHTYARLAREELGVEPSEELVRLVGIGANGDGAVTGTRESFVRGIPEARARHSGGEGLGRAGRCRP
jgi:DNA-binding SARP family transcriptional activator